MQPRAETCSSARSGDSRSPTTPNAGRGRASAAAFSRRGAPEGRRRRLSWVCSGDPTPALHGRHPSVALYAVDPRASSPRRSGRGRGATDRPCSAWLEHRRSCTAVAAGVVETCVAFDTVLPARARRSSPHPARPISRRRTSTTRRARSSQPLERKVRGVRDRCGRRLADRSRSLSPRGEARQSMSSWRLAGPSSCASTSRSTSRRSSCRPAPTTGLSSGRRCSVSFCHLGRRVRLHHRGWCSRHR